MKGLTRASLDYILGLGHYRWRAWSPAFFGYIHTQSETTTRSHVFAGRGDSGIPDPLTLRSASAFQFPGPLKPEMA